MSAATTRQHAHDLIERMPAPQVAAVARLLEVMLDPISEALAAAPVEDERVGASEERDAARGRKWLDTHEGIEFAEVLNEMGQTLARPRRRRARSR